jgi:hypothetical protein
MSQKVDITPTPRILRTLGDIPFEVWQCLAELADNSLDSFRECERVGKKVDGARLDIYWSTESAPAHDREIIIQDNGTGMTLEQLQNAARAGFSNNDPIHNLGLFGMGFNIATARLGDETLFVSTVKGSDKWVGIRIDFNELVLNRTFSAPVVSFEKESITDQGTKIIVKKLKDGVFGDLKRKSGSIRTRLETIYSSVLEREKVDLYLQGKLLRPRPHCVWGETRYVVRKSQKVHAVKEIDRDLGDAWFDLERNRYLSDDEAADFDVRESLGSEIPENIVRRARRLKGWIGIQRYSDPSDFGIDFIRNGRKILVSDKSIFGYENPDTGSFVLEYPVELGSTVGGRIIGEINVDYLIPTYQKNGFDTTDKAWRLTVDALRGGGPILPKKRKALGYDGDNYSPLGSLVNAFRRADPGTKNLSLASGIAKEFFKEFKNGNPDYIPDDKWYRAAQEADRERNVPKTPVNRGAEPTDNPEIYGPPGGPSSIPSAPATEKPKEPRLTTQRDDLVVNSEREESLCGKYAYDKTPGFEVTAKRTLSRQIKVDGKRLPFIIFQDGIEIDFYYDETHSLLSEYPVTPKQLLLQALAEKFALRDSGTSMHEAFLGLVDNHMEDERINLEALKERSHSVLTSIREKLPELLRSKIKEVLSVIRNVPSEEEKLAAILIEEDPGLLNEYQSEGSDAYRSLGYVTNETLIRLVDNFPEDFMDDRIFRIPYSSITIGDEDAVSRLQKIALGKILAYLRDIETLLKSGGTSPGKSELIRYANTLLLLEDRLG